LSFVSSFYLTGSIMENAEPLVPLLGSANNLDTGSSLIQTAAMVPSTLFGMAIGIMGYIGEDLGSSLA